jgi:hypothetical protein
MLADVEAKLFEKFGVKARAPLAAVADLPAEGDRPEEKRARVKAVK